MKIAIVNNFYAPTVLGGAEYSVQIRAEALVALGHRVTVLALAPDGRPGEGEINGVRVHYCALRTLGSNLTDRRRSLAGRVLWHLSAEFNPHLAATLTPILERERPDVLNTVNLAGISVGLWPLADRLGVPLVHTLFGYYPMCVRGTMFRGGRNCGRQCADCWAITLRRRLASRHVDGLVGAGRYILERLLRAGYFPNARVREAIFDAYEPPPAAAEAPAEAPAEAHAGVQAAGDRELRIGFLGRFHPTKGLDRLLAAIPALPERGWRLIVAGHGTESQEAALKARPEWSRVDFRGWMETEAFFAEIDVLVVPSLWHDPLPRTVFEALGHGVPVIGARRGGIPEMIEDGATGWLFDPAEPGSLERLLSRLVAQPEQARCRAGRCREQSARYAPRAHAEAYLRVYESVLGSARGTA